MENQFHFRGNLDAKGSRSNLYNICPDTKLSSIGFYKKNDWTKYADKKLDLLRYVKDGINEDNYQILLHWSYGMLATSVSDDPAVDYTRNLEMLAGGLFKIPFLMSFEEKGLSNFNCRNKDGFGFKKIILKPADGINYSIEREFFRGRFGNPVIRERYYSNNVLDGIDILYFDKDDRLLLKHDDAKRWNYQQWNSFFLVGSKTALATADDDNIFRLNDVYEPLGPYLHLHERRAFLNLSNGEVQQPRGHKTFNVAQSY